METNFLVLNFTDMGVFEDLAEGRMSVQSGQPAIFNLPPIESEPAPTVTWQTEEGSLNYDIKYAVTEQNQLIILSADESDRKAYRAIAINPQLGKEENSPYIHLNVTGDPYTELAPEIIVHPRDLSVQKGAEVTKLECIANARRLHELETLWMKDGIAIENSGVQYTIYDPWNRTLALISANLTHSGNYSCQVRLRSGGFEPIVSEAIVTVHDPPTFFTPMRAETLGEYGNQVILPCDVVGIPVPKVTWYKNAQKVDVSGERYTMNEDNSLVIKRMTMDDSAMFQCLASNDVGEKSSYTWIRVKSKYRNINNLMYRYTLN